MREKLWLAVIILAILASQFGIAVIVTGLHDEQEDEWVGLSDTDISAIISHDQLSADMHCEAALRIWEAGNLEWRKDAWDALLGICELNGQ